MFSFDAFSESPFSAIPSVAVNATANVTGVEATGLIGIVTAVGDGNTAVIGVLGTGEVGIVTATGAANANITGVESTATAGTVTAFGNASTAVSGVQSTGAVGTVSAVGNASTVVIGVEGIGETGTVTATGTAGGNAFVTGVEAIGSVGDVTATAAIPEMNGGFGYPFIIEPDRIIPPRHGVAEVKSAYAKGIVSKIFATGDRTRDASVSLEKMMKDVMLNLLSEQELTNPTEEELVALLLMD